MWSQLRASMAPLVELVSPNITALLLMLAGDVETNPGPGEGGGYGIFRTDFINLNTPYATHTGYIRAPSSLTVGFKRGNHRGTPPPPAV